MGTPRLIGAMLVAAMGVLPLAPPEHAHEVEEQGHHRLLVHRHVEVHEPVADAHHGGVFDHGEAAASRLDAVFVVPPILLTPPPLPSALPWLSPPRFAPIFRAPEYVERLIHGPPRAPTALRAPPSISRL